MVGWDDIVEQLRSAPVPDLRAEIALWRALQHGRHTPAAPRSRLRRRWRRQHTPRPPDGLLTSAEAAAKLRCSIKTLNVHVANGDLRYVTIGRGSKRPRKFFTDADLDAFIANQTRKAPPCRSTASPGRRSGTTILSTKVIAFSDLQRKRPGGKPRK